MQVISHFLASSPVGRKALNFEGWFPEKKRGKNKPSGSEERKKIMFKARKKPDKSVIVVRGEKASIRVWRDL